MQERVRKDIEIVFKAHYREFCLLSYSYVSCPSAAQDIVQDIFVGLLTKNKEVEISNLKGYIYKAVKYASLKQVKHSRKRAPLNENTLVLAFPEEESRLAPSLASKLIPAVEQLPGRCKEVFELCALDGQKYKTAANSLGISVNTVKTQMKKAYRILRYDLRNTYPVLLFLEFAEAFFS